LGGGLAIAVEEGGRAALNFQRKDFEIVQQDQVRDPSPTNRAVSIRCRMFSVMSELGQSTKSLRSSPLRGSKSREAGIRSRGQRWRGGKVNTIRSCIVGVQRMVKNSKDHLAGRHPDAASHIDPP